LVVIQRARKNCSREALKIEFVGELAADVALRRGDFWLRILIKIHERHPIVSQCGNHVRKSYSSAHGFVQKKR